MHSTTDLDKKVILPDGPQLAKDRVYRCVYSHLRTLPPDQIVELKSSFDQTLLASRIPPLRHRVRLHVKFVLRNLGPPLKATQHKKLLSRRVLLTVLLRLPLIAGIVASSRRTFAARREPRSDAHVERTIAAVIDCMLPGGELPGALALGIDRHIAATTGSELKRSFIEGVAWLDQRARAKGTMNFLKLDEAGRETVLQAALRSDAEGAFAIVRTLRNLAFTLYYTDPAIMAAFAYSGPPQPDGFPDFQEAPR